MKLKREEIRLAALSLDDLQENLARLKKDGWTDAKCYVIQEYDRGMDENCRRRYISKDIYVVTAHRDHSDTEQ